MTLDHIFSLLIIEMESALMMFEYDHKDVERLMDKIHQLNEGQMQQIVYHSKNAQLRKTFQNLIDSNEKAYSKIKKLKRDDLETFKSEASSIVCTMFNDMVKYVDDYLTNK